MDLVGVVTEGDAIYNYNKSGDALALGRPVQREYHWNEWDFYGQDTWRVRKTYGYGGTEIVVFAGAGRKSTGCKSVRAYERIGCHPYALSDFYNSSGSKV